MVDGDVDISEQALNVVLASVRVLWACLRNRPSSMRHVVVVAHDA